MKHGDIVVYEGRKAEVFDVSMKDGKEMLILEFLDGIESRGTVDGVMHMRSAFSMGQDRLCAVPACETRLFADSNKATRSIEIRRFR